MVNDIPSRIKKELCTLGLSLQLTEFDSRLADVILLSTPEYKKVLITSKANALCMILPRIKYSKIQKWYTDR